MTMLELRTHYVMGKGIRYTVLLWCGDNVVFSKRVSRERYDKLINRLSQREHYVRADIVNRVRFVSKG